MNATTNVLLSIIGLIALYLFYSVIIVKPKPVTQPANLNFLSAIDDEFVNLSIAIRNSRTIGQLKACRVRMVRFYRQHGEKVNAEIERLLDIYEDQEVIINKTIKH